MGGLISRDEEGVLSLIDAGIFALIMILVSLFIFQQFGGPLTQKRELEGADLRYEASEDIQNMVLDSVIRKTGYLNKSGRTSEEVYFSNITVKRAVRNYHYLKNSEKSRDELDYNLSRLKEDVKQRYERCAWEVSRYHFAASSSHGNSTLFFSDDQNCDNLDDIPSDRSAAQSVITEGLDRVTITLYIWR